MSKWLSTEVTVTYGDLFVTIVAAFVIVWCVFRFARGFARGIRDALDRKQP